MVRDKLWQAIGGQREVPGAFGRIDLLTDSELIECKEVRGWKAALGQVLAYSLEYPGMQRRIHLFGKCSPRLMSSIHEYCAYYEVAVTWDGEPPKALPPKALPPKALPPKALPPKTAPPKAREKPGRPFAFSRSFLDRAR